MKYLSRFTNWTRFCWNQKAAAPCSAAPGAGVVVTNGGHYQLDHCHCNLTVHHHPIWHAPCHQTGSSVLQQHNINNVSHLPVSSPPDRRTGTMIRFAECGHKACHSSCYGEALSLNNPEISRSIKLFGTRIAGPSGHFERTLRRRDATKDEQKNSKVISNPWTLYVIWC